MRYQPYDYLDGHGDVGIGPATNIKTYHRQGVFDVGASVSDESTTTSTGLQNKNNQAQMDRNNTQANNNQTRMDHHMAKQKLRGRELNPGLPRDRRKY